MWPPAMPTTAESIGTPDICSAMSTASATASAARSISTTAPLRTPLEATRPTPKTRRPVLSRSATAQQTLVVPRSSAKTRRGRVTVSVSECSRRGCAIQGFSGAKPQDAGFARPVCHNMLVVLERSDGRRPFSMASPWARDCPLSGTRDTRTGPRHCTFGRDPVRRGRVDRRGCATVAPPAVASTLPRATDRFARGSCPGAHASRTIFPRSSPRAISPNAVAASASAMRRADQRAERARWRRGRRDGAARRAFPSCVPAIGDAPKEDPVELRGRVRSAGRARHDHHAARPHRPQAQVPGRLADGVDHGVDAEPPVAPMTARAVSRSTRERRLGAEVDGEAFAWPRRATSRTR